MDLLAEAYKQATEKGEGNIKLSRATDAMVTKADSATDPINEWVGGGQGERDGAISRKEWGRDNVTLETVNRPSFGRGVDSAVTEAASEQEYTRDRQDAGKKDSTWGKDDAPPKEDWIPLPPRPTGNSSPPETFYPQGVRGRLRKQVEEATAADYLTHLRWQQGVQKDPSSKWRDFRDSTCG